MTSQTVSLRIFDPVNERLSPVIGVGDAVIVSDQIIWGADTSGGGGGGALMRQDIVFSLPYPVYMNENAIRQDIVYTTYMNET